MFLALKTVVETEMEMYKLLVQTLQIVKYKSTNDLINCRRGGVKALIAEQAVACFSLAR
jgi:hypothetical protein